MKPGPHTLHWLSKYTYCTVSSLVKPCGHISFFCLMFHFRSKERRLLKLSLSHTLHGFPNTHAARSAQLAKGVDQYPFTAIVLRFRNTHQVHMLDSQLYSNMHLSSPCMFPFAPCSFCRSSEVSIGFRVATLTR